jgi:hypothetical protein
LFVLQYERKALKPLAVVRLNRKLTETGEPLLPMGGARFGEVIVQVNAAWLAEKPTLGPLAPSQGVPVASTEPELKVQPPKLPAVFQVWVYVIWALTGVQQAVISNRVQTMLMTLFLTAVAKGTRGYWTSE